MKKKILSWILAFFGLLGFAMVYSGAIGAFADNPQGIVFAKIGFAVIVGVFAADYFFGRRPPPLSFDKRWQKLKAKL